MSSIKVFLNFHRLSKYKKNSGKLDGNSKKNQMHLQKGFDPIVPLLPQVRDDSFRRFFGFGATVLSWGIRLFFRSQHMYFKAPNKPLPRISVYATYFGSSVQEKSIDYFPKENWLQIMHTYYIYHRLKLQWFENYCLEQGWNYWFWVEGLWGCYSLWTSL